MSHEFNLQSIKTIYNALDILRHDVVFAGGATVSLYADRMAEEARPTDDVDILIESWTYKDYTILEGQLRAMGFANDITSTVICRYKVHGLTVDITPTGKDVIGFSNSWYPDGFKNSIAYPIDDKETIRIFSAPYFIASKLEAFKSQYRLDNNNGSQSQDFEDIVFVLENRSSIWEEFNNAPAEVKAYLQKEFKKLQQNSRFEEWIDGHVSRGSPPATYYIIDMLKHFTTSPQ